MPWESRKGSTEKYYTRTIRTGGKRERIYFGSGTLAELAALQDAQRRIEQEIRRRDGKNADQASDSLSDVLDIFRRKITPPEPPQK